MKLFSRLSLLISTTAMLSVAFGQSSVPGEVIVGLKPGYSASESMERQFHSVGSAKGYDSRIRAYRLEIDDDVSMSDAIFELRRKTGVAYVEPNYLFKSFANPNDTLFGQQYAPQITKANQAWELWNPQATVVVAIVDTGVQLNHPDLTNKILRNNGIVVGYDYVNNDADPSDDHGHGTHCAGIAAAQINNGIGIAGVAGWNGQAGVTDSNFIKIMPMKVLGSDGVGSSTAIASGIMFAVDNGAKVISLSLGAPTQSQTLTNAINYAWNNGAVIVGAAGNAGNNIPNYPGATANVITVGATDSSDTMASFSCYGDWVDIAAPGASIRSTLPGSVYGLMSGTSMSTPFVAGEAALLMSQNPDLTNQEIVDLIIGNVDPYNANGKPMAPGAGRANVLTALQAAGSSGEPGEISGVTINPTTVYGGSGASLVISLASPAPSGGVLVNLSSSDAFAFPVPATATVPVGQTSVTVGILTGNVTESKSVTVTASNSMNSAQGNATVTPLLKQVVLNPTSVRGGLAASIQVQLNGPAPTGGVVVSLSSSSSSASVPSTVTVNAGATSASANVSTFAVSNDTETQISAGLRGVTKSATLQIRTTEILSLTFVSGSIVDGGTTTATVKVATNAPASGLNILLSSSNESATVPASVFIPSGANSASFVVTGSPVLEPSSAMITATLGQSEKSAQINVVPLFAGISINPTGVRGGTSATGTVLLNGNAPTGGRVIQLSDNSGNVTVPASVTVLAGKASATFTISTAVVNQDELVQITGSSGLIVRSAQLTLAPALLTSITLTPTKIGGGGTGVGIVKISNAAPSDGLQIQLSSESAYVQLPDSVTVPAGATQVSFSYNSLPTSVSRTASIVAQRGAVIKTANVTIAPMLYKLGLSATSLRGGSSVSATLSLNFAAPSGGMVVSLSSNSPFAMVPNSVIVPAGLKSVKFSVSTLGVGSNQVAQISASRGENVVFANLSIKPPTLMSISLAPTTVVGGNSSVGTVRIDGPAPEGGLVINLLSSNASANLPASVVIPFGMTSANFEINTISVSASTSSSIKATFGAIAKSVTLRINKL